ncbi:MAG: PDZ domain-containing protein [Thermomonas sp.]|nr:PDZ domain-containing protein [Thermomonas sp.]
MPVDSDAVRHFDIRIGRARSSRLDGGVHGPAHHFRRQDGSPGINGVEKDSPAIRAGLMSGDIIESLNGMTVTGQSGRKLFKAMAAIRTGDSVRMTVLRGGKRLSVSMVAG